MNIKIKQITKVYKKIKIIKINFIILIKQNKNHPKKGSKKYK